jgi:hypothetical protein
MSLIVRPHTSGIEAKRLWSDHDEKPIELMLEGSRPA